MDNRTPEAEARKTLERHRTARFAWSTWATPLVLFVFISICAGASALLQVNTQQRIISAPAPLTNIPQIASSRVTSTHQLRVVFVDAKPGDNPDLFLSDVPSRTLTQLTNTPAITEAWPVFDSEGNYIAYYGLVGSMIEVYVQQIPTGLPTIVTQQSGKSGVHVSYEIGMSAALDFSPDSKWVAFPVRSTVSSTVEIGVARADGSQVLDVFPTGHRLISYAWLDDTTLVALFQLLTGQQQKWLGHIEPPKLRMEPMP